MSEPMPPVQQKKGMGVLGWILIGCGSLVFLGGVAFVGTTWWVAHKVKNFAEKAEKNPNYAAVKVAELAVRMNPDVELVSSDADKGTLTIRDKKSGEEYTLSAEDISKGKFKISKGGEEVNVDVSGTADGGTVKVTSDKGTATFGAGTATETPSWVPLYPDTKAEGVSSFSAGSENSGTFAMSTKDGVDKILAFYESKLQAEGFKIEKATGQIQGLVGGNLTATTDTRTVNITVSSQDGGSQILVAFHEKQ